MSEQQKNLPKTDAATLDATSAAAALADAVTSAEKLSGTPVHAIRAGAGAVLEKGKTHLFAGWRKYGIEAVTLALAVSLGLAGGSMALSKGDKAQIVPGWAEAAANIRENTDHLVRLTDEVRALKSVVEALQENVERAKSDAAGPQDRLAETLGRIERASEAAITKIDHLSGSAERVQADAAAKLADMMGRLQTIERQAATLATKNATASAGPADPAQTGSVPEAKPTPKQTQPETKPAPKQTLIEGYVLRDVFRGVALVESRSGHLYEVAPGRTLPRAGRVEAIERRGGTWVVVTSKGIIGAPMRWQ